MKPVLDCVAPTQPLLPFDSIALGRRAFLGDLPRRVADRGTVLELATRKGARAEGMAKSSGSRIRHACARPASRVGTCRTVFESHLCSRVDGWLARETGLRLEAVQRALSKLGEGGAILRADVPNGRSFQRRIFLAAAIVRRHRMTRHGHGGDTRHDDRSLTRHRDGTEGRQNTRDVTRSVRDQPFRKRP